MPLVLTVTVIAGAAALTSTTTGCDDNPPVDAGVGDGLIDTPII